MARTTEPKTPKRQLVSLSTAAEYADCGVNTIRRWISEGRLPGYRLGPKLLKVDLNELDELAQRVPTAGA
ncbi:helix-turn-helix domain-containing protein [Pseudonocardia sp. RS11V-5]|uniref:helix-turn-helix domain-containing protein n=1 Tax=Pseudonocardia terrae TaxID=2905831 RepID=UPI001E61E3BD|nr:helix-turn-helix domain-containing protein [Pseudonocardia terrae]MCE3555444.1 helix-turn-helix domain-containing protein [Pseudonocardia terrae]